MPQCSFCRAGRAVGEFCRGGEAHPACLECVTAVGTKVYDMREVERYIQAIGMPVRKAEGGGGGMRKAGARRGSESDDDDDPLDITLVVDSDDETPASAAAPPPAAASSSSSSRPVLDLTLSDDEGSAPGTPADGGDYNEPLVQYDSADEAEGNSGASVVVFLRWDQYEIITNEWRFRAVVPANWSVRHVLRYIERQYGQPGVASDDDIVVVSATASWSAAAQGNIKTIRDVSRPIGMFASTVESPPRVGLAKNMRPLPSWQPMDFDASFYGKKSSDSGIAFTIVCYALDRECDVSAVPLYATWAYFLQKAHAECPALSRFTAHLAGRPIRSGSVIGVHEIAQSEQIYTTLAGYVYNLRGGITLVFE